MQSPELPSLDTNPDLLHLIILDENSEMDPKELYSRLMILNVALGKAMTKAKKKVIDELAKGDFELKHGSVSYSESQSFSYKGDPIYDDLIQQAEDRKEVLRNDPTTPKSIKKTVKWQVKK